MDTFAAQGTCAFRLFCMLGQRMVFCAKAKENQPLGRNGKKHCADTRFARINGGTLHFLRCWAGRFHPARVYTAARKKVVTLR